MPDERKTDRDVSIQYPPLGWREEGDMKKAPIEKWPQNVPFIIGLAIGSAAIGLIGVKYGIGWIVLLAFLASLPHNPKEY